MKSAIRGALRTSQRAALRFCFAAAALILMADGNGRAAGGQTGAGVRSAPQTSTLTRPQILGIAHLAIRVSDLAGARRFYGGVLGYDEHQPAQPGFAVFRVNDRQRLVIHGGLPPNQPERLVHLAFDTADVQAMRAYLVSRGLTVSEPLADRDGGGTAIDATDPDGHRVRFVQRDASPALVAKSASADRRISRRILHGGLTVRDAAAADRFYKEILGFSEIWRGGRTDEVTDWINMRVPDGTDYLEYMLVSGDVDRDRLGTLHHVALLVPDIQEALEAARTRSEGRNARANPQVGRNRRWQLNLYDPDGTRVEFMEPWPIK